MRTATRHAFNSFVAQIATLNNVPSAAVTFSVDPSVEQKLEDRIQQSADFLGEINIVGVDEQIAQTLGMGADAPIAGRTDTEVPGARREPRNAINMTPHEYRCRQTDYDHGITYRRLDQWAKFPNFQIKVRDHVTRQIARDRLTMGWHGRTAAATTDVVANPKLQDVQKGWLQKYREEAPERVLSGLKIGDAAGADFKNLDALVEAALESLNEWYQEDPSIVALTGRSLVTDKYVGLLNSSEVARPTEQNALKTMLLNKTLGSRQAKIPAFFPARTIFLTMPENLSIYWQNGTHRRMIKEEPERNRVVDYQSVNEDFVVEDFGAGVLIEGILLPDGNGGWA